MLAKITSKNQLTLPKSLVTSIGQPEYFDIELKDGQIVLTPVRLHQADAVRKKLEDLGIDEQDVFDAVTWARGSSK